MDYSTAEAQRDFSELIPNGTLAYGVLKIRRYNASMGVIETPSKSSDAKYLDCEITLQGEFVNRKIWTLIGVGGTEKYINMGRAQIRAILETGHDASPENPTAYVPLDPRIEDENDSRHYAVIDHYGEGVPVAIKISVDISEGYDDKNGVGVFLSPIADSGTKRDWDRLMGGDTKPSPNTRQPKGGGGTAAAKPLPSQPAWVGQAGQTSGAAVPVAPAPTNPPQPQPAQVTMPLSAPAPTAAAPSTVESPAPSATTGAPSATSPSSSPAAPSWLKAAQAAQGKPA